MCHVQISITRPVMLKTANTSQLTIIILLHPASLVIPPSTLHRKFMTGCRKSLLTHISHSRGLVSLHVYPLSPFIAYLGFGFVFWKKELQKRPMDHPPILPAPRCVLLGWIIANFSKLGHSPNSPEFLLLIRCNWDKRVHVQPKAQPVDRSTRHLLRWEPIAHLTPRRHHPSLIPLIPKVTS